MSSPAAPIVAPTDPAAPAEPRFLIEKSQDSPIAGPTDGPPDFLDSGRASPSAALKDFPEAGSSKVDAACALLADVLAAGPVPAAQMEQLTQQAGFTRGTVRRARQRLGIESWKDPGSIPSCWRWSLPGQVEQVATAEPASDQVDIKRWLPLNDGDQIGGRRDRGADQAGLDLAANNVADDGELAGAIGRLASAREQAEQTRIRLVERRSELGAAAFAALDGDPDALTSLADLEAEIVDLQRLVERRAAIVVEAERLVGMARLNSAQRAAERRREQEAAATRQRDTAYTELEQLLPHLTILITNLVDAGVQLGDRGRTAQRTVNRLFEVFHRAGLRGLPWPPSQQRGPLTEPTQPIGA